LYKFSDLKDLKLLRKLILYNFKTYGRIHLAKEMVVAVHRSKA